MKTTWTRIFFTLVAIMLGLSGCVDPGASEQEGGFRVQFVLPPSCDMQGTENSASCTFRSDTGRIRMIAVDTNELPSEEDYAGISEEDARQQARALIDQVDQNRRVLMPEGYTRASYAILPLSRTPAGMLACAKSRDTIPRGAGERDDRVHLHCWALTADRTNFGQMLLSYIERNTRGTRVSPAFARDADAFLSTLVVIEAAGIEP